MFSLDKSKNDTSVTLDLLRAVAAQMVCAGHGLVFFQVGSWLKPPYLPAMQNVGVLLFFVMSGLLITSTLARSSQKPDYGFGAYFIDRFARIYSALIPALAFVILLDGITIWLTGEHTIERYYNWPTLAANLSMLEAYRGFYDNHDALQWSAFGSAAPLWTLAIEWHIYMFAGAAFFLAKGRGSWLLLIPIAVVFGQTPMHFLFGAFESSGVGTGLFAMWLGGAAIYFGLSRYVPPLWISIPAVVIAVTVYALMVSPGHEYEMRTYPALLLMVGSLIAITQRTKAISAAKLVGITADYSFTLYLIHYTVISAITLIFGATGWLWFFAAVMASNALAYLIARYTEMRHREFARWIAGGIQRFVPYGFRRESP
jgi:peptidoglycan/LPS O-acetylase OafA/YrhL